MSRWKCFVNYGELHSIMEYSEALLWLLLFQVQQERLDLGKMAESPGWPGGEEDLFLYQQINVGKAL